MAPVLTEPDKDPETPPAEHGAAPPLSPPLPRHSRRLGRHLHALLKSNLKNLLADCGAQLDVCAAAAGGLCHFSPPDLGAMKNVLGDHCKPTNGIMDSGEKLKKEEDCDMGLHSANSSNLQELLNNKKQFAGSMVAHSPPSDLADMIHEFETLAERAPLTSGNGHVPPDEMQMITQLVTSMDENPPVTAAVDVAPPPSERPEQQPAPAVAARPPPVTQPTLTVEEARTRQAQLTGRSARLMRRLRALQAHTARRQTTAQTEALLERMSAAHAAPAATPSGAAGSTATSSIPSPAAAGTAPVASGDISEMLRSPNVKHFSTTQLVNLVLNNKSAAAAGVTAVPPPPVTPSSADVASSSARVERELAAACARPAGVARRQTERLLTAADSDATESSSGGESADEFEPGWDDEALERAAPIRKRALWRWATDRSALACRWSWLAAQVTDLEFRVRQLRQLHRQLRAANPRPVPGPVRPARSAPAPAAARELGGAGDACSAAALTDHEKASEAADADADCGDGQCARSRPRPSAPRRRVFTVSRAARRTAGGAPARCRCDPGSAACPVCAGRPDAAAGRVQPDVQPARERRALLSAGHHPVLSLPAEAALSLGYDALLRSPRWQQNHLHARPRGPRLITKEAAIAAASAAPGPGGGGVSTPPVTPCSRPSFHHRRKSGHMKRYCDVDGGGGGGGEGAAHGGSNGHGHGHARLGRPPKLCRRSRSSSVCDARPAAGAGPLPPGGDDDSTGWSGSGRQSPERRESRERLAAERRAARHHRQNSYDIDNIVIPASMASTAKIEKPKYKEIVTPGWRSVDVGSPAVNGQPAEALCDGSRSPASSVSPEPPESLEDAAFERRHRAAELEERRRLYQAAGKPPGGTAAAAAGGTGTPGAGRGRRAHTPDAPRTPIVEVTPGGELRPRILRYMYSLEPCGFPARQFPLSDRVWSELQASAESEDSLLHVGWRSPRSRSASSAAAAGGAEPTPWEEDPRATK